MSTSRTTGAGPGEGPTLGPDPERLVPLVEACPGVAGLHGGRYGEVGTYLPGRRVRGVRVTGSGVEIHVVARYPVTVAEVAAQVRAAVAAEAGALAVHVTIADVVLPGDPEPAGPIERDPLRTSPTGPDRPASASGPESGSGAEPVRPRAGAPAFPPPPTDRPGDTAAPWPPARGLDAKETSR